MWRCLTEFHNPASVEFLPVYHPNVAERQDAALFASNVRNVMAKALEAEVSNASFEDAIIVKEGSLFRLKFGTQFAVCGS